MPPPSVVVTDSGPGNSVFTTPALAMAPSICAMKTKQPREKGTAPTRHSPSVTYKHLSVRVAQHGPWFWHPLNEISSREIRTAGLNRPPETRKKIHALTVNEKAKARLMYNRTIGFGPCGSEVLSLPDVV